jgi:hypothetical protein
VQPVWCIECELAVEDAAEILKDQFRMLGLNLRELESAVKGQ